MQIPTKAYWVVLWRHFWISIGFLWMVVEISGHLGWKPFENKGPVGTLFFCLIALIGALIWSIPPKTVSANIPNSNVTVTVKLGDVLDAKDNVVIGLNDVFDTEIGNGIISPNSLQGQFTTKIYQGNWKLLDADLQPSLANLRPVPDPTKTIGKNLRYPLGTVVMIPKVQTKYFLAAYCRMTNTLRAETTTCELFRCMDEIWDAVRNLGNREGVSMAVIGSDYARLGLTQTQLIQLIVLSYLAYEKRGLHIAPTLTIYVWPGKAPAVDFTALRMWLRGVLWS